MGTRTVGPFGNEGAREFLAELFEGVDLDAIMTISDEKLDIGELGTAVDFEGLDGTLLATVAQFVDDPRIDENFDEAFASVAVLNAMSGSGYELALPDPEEARRWRAAFLLCFDEQPSPATAAATPTAPDWKTRQRAAVSQELDALVAICEGRSAPENPES